MQVFMMPDYRHDNPYQTLLANALQKEGVNVTFPVGYRRVFPIYRAIKSNPEKIDLLHLHWLDPYLKGDNIFVKLIYCIKFLIDITLTRLSGVKAIWTVHNLVSHNSRFPRLELWTQTILGKLVDFCITHNQSSAAEVAQRYKLSLAKVVVIPHGHYRDIYQPAVDAVEARQRLELPEKGSIYLNLGMLKPYKGLERLIQIWREHASFLQDSTLLIVGKALDDGYGQTLSKHSLGTKNIIFRNTFVASDEIHLYFSAADLVILPFERILTSGSLLLAMSYGKPVIAPRLGGVVETVGETGWFLYDPDDPTGLIHALKDSLAADLSSLTPQIDATCDRLGWEIIGQKTKKIYQAVCSDVS
jgi:glycosyltransferase involved in cell wall biosynthesis